MITTLKIKHLNSSGIGIAFDGDKQIEVPYTLPNEVVEVDVFQNKDRSFFGRLQNVVETSPERTQPVCKHFANCGGCLLQHIEPAVYENFKRNKIIQSLKAHGVPYDKVKDVMILGPGIRRRIDFQAKKYPDELVIGFHRRKSKRLVNLEECKIVDEKIESLFKPLHELMDQILSEKQMIHLFMTDAANGLDILMAGFREEPEEDILQLLRDFAQREAVIRLQIKTKKKTMTVFEAAKPYVRFGDYQVPVSPNAFLQASHKADQVLADLMIEALPQSAKKVADLFCGRGTLTLPLLRHVERVDGFECDKRSIDVLKQLGLPGLKAYFRNLFSAPLTLDELSQYDCIVLDPPRCGAEEQAKQLSESKIPTVIYVSCDPDSFARDASLLSAGGYTLEKVTPVDQFMWSAHTELVAVFQRSAFFD